MKRITVADLKRQADRATDAYCEFNDSLTKPRSDDDVRRLDQLFEAADRAWTIYDIAKGQGLEAAMLFKLTFG